MAYDHPPHLHCVEVIDFHRSCFIYYKKMSTVSIYGELNANPENHRIKLAFKGLHEYIEKMNTPNIAYPDQEIYIEIPTGTEGDVIIPQIPKVTFSLDLESSRNACNVASNVSRSLIVKKKKNIAMWKTVEVISNCSVYDTCKRFIHDIE